VALVTLILHLESAGTCEFNLSSAVLLLLLLSPGHC
jgi:hypothetical protein